MRERIVRTEAKRSAEILYVRSRDDFEPVSDCVQPWADRLTAHAAITCRLLR
jgi:hypothetical protein